MKKFKIVCSARVSPSQCRKNVEIPINTQDIICNKIEYINRGEVSEKVKFIKYEIYDDNIVEIVVDEFWIGLDSKFEIYEFIDEYKLIDSYKIRNNIL